MESSFKLSKRKEKSNGNGNHTYNYCFVFDLRRRWILLEQAGPLAAANVPAGKPKS
jgi:hypothetical protein